MRGYDIRSTLIQVRYILCLIAMVLTRYLNRLRYAPYASVISCLREVATEEGFSALFRGWYATIIFIVFASL